MEQPDINYGKYHVPDLQLGFRYTDPEEQLLIKRQVDLFEKTAFEISAQITKNYSTSFYWASRILDREMRYAIYAIYGFVRFADEIVDTFHHTDKKQVLELFERDYMEAIENSISMNPVLHSFVLVMRKYNISPSLVDAFLSSMKKDLDKKTWLVPGELDEYIYGSAEVVGLMCLKVFVNGCSSFYEELEEPARKLGSAFQKVNFLRDMKDDAALLGRSYFPDFTVEKYGDNLSRKLVNEIRDEFMVARSGIEKLPGRSKLAVYIAWVFYLRLLKKIERAPAGNIMKMRVRISNPVKFVLFLYSVIRYKFGLI